MNTELTFPNMGMLRELCLEQKQKHPKEELTAIDWNKATKAMTASLHTLMAHDPSKKTTTATTFPWMLTMCADLAPTSEARKPKWTAFVEWLDIETGVCLQAPILVATIVQQSLQGHM